MKQTVVDLEVTKCNARNLYEQRCRPLINHSIPDEQISTFISALVQNPSKYKHLIREVSPRPKTLCHAANMHSSDLLVEVAIYK